MSETAPDQRLYGPWPFPATSTVERTPFPESIPEQFQLKSSQQSPLIRTNVAERTRRCSDCLTWKAETAFTLDASDPLIGRAHQCRKCRQEEDRKKRAAAAKPRKGWWWN